MLWSLIGQCRDPSSPTSCSFHPKLNRDFVTRTQNKMQQWTNLMEERGTRPDCPMKPQVVAHRLNEVLDDDAIICCDTGR